MRREREHVLASEPAPDVGEIVEHVTVESVTGDVGGVEGADGGADEQIGCKAVDGEGLEHADLYGAEAAAAGQDEGCGHAFEVWPRSVPRRGGNGRAPTARLTR